MSAPDPLALIEETRRLSEAAEPGEWVAGRYGYVLHANGDGIVVDKGDHSDRPEGTVVCVRGVGRGAPIDANAALIARYRTLAPALADALEASTAALREERQNAEMLRERLAEAEQGFDDVRQSLYSSIAECKAAESRAVAAEAKVAELERATRWIPVIERLPEIGQSVLLKISYLRGASRTTSIIESWGLTPGHWGRTSSMAEPEPIAWRPWPSPDEAPL